MHPKGQLQQRKQRRPTGQTAARSHQSGQRTHESSHRASEQNAARPWKLTNGENGFKGDTAHRCRAG